MVNPLYLPELREYLADHNAAELKEFCEALHPARTADFMEGLDCEEAWEVLKPAIVKHHTMQAEGGELVYRQAAMVAANHFGCMI